MERLQVQRNTMEISCKITDVSRDMKYGRSISISFKGLLETSTVLRLMSVLFCVTGSVSLDVFYVFALVFFV